MLDLLLICSLGFLGSFGHCAGMCGPIATAFALSMQPPPNRSSATPSDAAAIESATASATGAIAVDRAMADSIRFHLLLNLGRILSYLLVGAAIGAIGSVLLAGGQMAGVGSGLRRGMALLTGSLLIWFGLLQICPQGLPQLPIFHPFTQGKLHQRLHQSMLKLSFERQWWTPFLLGMIWGLIPCGFLYAAQIKAAETGSLWMGSATLLAFGLGTMPTMLGVGLSAARLSADRRSQLARIGGWVTLTIGVLTLLRTGDMMADYTGDAALLCLMLALIARPLSRIWAVPLRYRRVLGVGAFVLALAHTLHMVEHAWQWNLRAIWFMLPQHQWGIGAGSLAILLMLPAALTSFDRAQKWLGSRWRALHLLAVPALILASLHCILAGSRYLGAWQLTAWNYGMVGVLSVATLTVLLIRSRWTWQLIAQEQHYSGAKRDH